MNRRSFFLAMAGAAIAPLVARDLAAAPIEPAAIRPRLPRQIFRAGQLHLSDSRQMHTLTVEQMPSHSHSFTFTEPPTHGHMLPHYRLVGVPRCA